MNGLPSLLLLPDAPHPGRSHRTHQPGRRTQPGTGRGRRRHLPPFIPDTNPIEALNRQLRKAVKTKGSFPSEEATIKLLYLAIHNAVPQWTKTRGWTKAMLAFKIQFGDRIHD